MRSNLVILGAEQDQDQDSRSTSRYFEKYVLAVNVGGAIAILIVPYVQKVLPNSDYYILYIVVIVIVSLAGSLFWIGWRYYLHVPTRDSVIFYLIPVLRSACRSWYTFKKQPRKKNRQPTVERNVRETRMKKLNNTTGQEELEESGEGREKLPSILDYARSQYGGSCLDRHVDEVKALRNALVVFMLLIPFWLIENQVESNEIAQSIIDFSSRMTQLFNLKRSTCIGQCLNRMSSLG